MTRATPQFAALLAVILMLPSGPAWAGDDPPPPKDKWERTWTLTEGDVVRGALKLSGVHSATDVQYVSGDVLPVGKAAVRTVFHEQRNPGGVLKKYRRYAEVRLGKGVMAFAKGETVRLVGIKQKLAPVVLGGATGYLLHDPGAPQMLDLVARFLSRSSAEVSFPMVDLGARKATTVVARPGEPLVVGDPEGKRTDVRSWSLAGLGDAVTVYVDGKRLVGAKVGARAALLEGWSWTPAAAKPEPAPEPEPEPETPAAGEAEDIPPGAAGVVAGEEDPGEGP